MGLWHKCTRTPVGRPDGHRFTFAPIDLTENAQATEVPRPVCSWIVGHSDAVPNHSTLGLDADPVIDGDSNALLAAEIPIGRLNRAAALSACIGGVRLGAIVPVQVGDFSTSRRSVA